MVPHSGIAAEIIFGNSKLAAVIHDNNPKKVKQAVWDVAAVQLIVEEAGGVVWNMKGERYDKFHPELFIITKSPGLAKEICALAHR